MIYFLAFVYFLVFIYGIKGFRCILNPITLFAIGLLLSMIVCIANYNEWDLKSFHLNTFSILLFSAISFVIGCLFIHYRYKRIKGTKDLSYLNFSLSKKWLIVYLIFSSAVVLYSFKYLIGTTGATNISEAAYINYRSNFVEGDSSLYMLPMIPRLLKSTVFYLNFYFCFILANKLANGEPLKNTILLILICIVSTLGGLTTGSRGSVFETVIYFIILYVFFKSRMNGFRNKINLKQLLKASILCLLFLFLFFKSGTLVGRDTSENDDILSYLSAYVGAQPKNLDLFMNESHFVHNIPGSHTFKYIYSIFVPIEPVYELSMFRFVNEYPLGNVYTGFANYYLDFGILGTIVFCFFLGAFFQYLFECSIKKTDLKKQYFSFKVFLYAYFAVGLLLNFFGERIGNLVSPNTLKCIVTIFVFDFIVRKFTKKSITNITI